MAKLPVLSASEIIKSLLKAGFIQKRQRGSHIIFIKIKDGKKMAVVVPNHKEIDPGTLLSIIRQSKMSRKEFLELL